MDAKTDNSGLPGEEMNTKLNDLRTPSLLLNLDIMEGNLHRMASHFRHGKGRLRPHFKNHQVLALAAKQVEAGASESLAPGSNMPRRW